MPSIQCISSSHRAQVITPCSTSPQQIISVTDKVTLFFSEKGFFFFKFSLNLFTEESQDTHDRILGGFGYVISHVPLPFCVTLFLVLCLGLRQRCVLEMELHREEEAR